jgi:thiamine pyrophosphate-dependent acetolactate synthase large subunit-like protein
MNAGRRRRDRSARPASRPAATGGRRLSTAAELVVAALRAEGVRHAFGLVGTHIVEIYEALRAAPEIAHVTARHEGNGALMADACSRLSGRPSVCFSTAGPGILNALAGIGQAYAANSPTVHICGSLPLGAPRRALHAVDDERHTVKATQPLTRMSARPASLAELARTLPQLFAAALGPEPGPVHLEIPWDLMRAPAAAAPAYARRPSRAGGGAGTLRALAAALGAAERPLFCIDRLCVHHGLAAEVVALAEATGAALAVSYDAFGAVPTAHPLNAGVVSDFFFGTAALEAAREADLVVGFGVLAGSEVEALLAGQRRAPPDLVDARSLAALRRDGGLGRLAARLRRAPPRAGWFRRRCGEEWLAAARALAGPRRRGAMHFGRAMLRLRERIDRDTTVILDAGSHEIWARSLLPSFGPASFIGSGNWGGMGYGLPGLIGARLALPERRAIAVTGDGCLLMTLSDLCTLAGIAGPAILIVMNNAMYGEIKRVQLERFGAATQIANPPLDFAAIARDCGLAGLRVAHEGALDAALDRAFAADRPVLVDIVCGDDVAFPSLP